MRFSNRKWLLASLAAGMISLGSHSSAQDRAVAEASVGGEPQVNRVSTILKTKVLIQEDQPAGEIVDIVYTEGGCIDYVIASYDDQYYAVPFDAIVVRPKQQVVFVDIAPTRFREIQFFGNDNWPDFHSAAYRDQVFANFQINVDARGRRGRDRDDRDRVGDRDRDDNRGDRDRGEADRDRDDREPGDRRPGDRDDDRPTPRPERDAGEGEKGTREPGEREPSGKPAPKPGVKESGEKPNRPEAGDRPKPPAPRADAPKPAPKPPGLEKAPVVPGPKSPVEPPKTPAPAK